MRSLALILLLGLVACGADSSGDDADQNGGGNPPPSAPLRTDCETRVNPASFSSVDDLAALHERLANYGLRATANPAHQAYLDWLEAELRKLPGAVIREIPYEIPRWSHGAIQLNAGPATGALQSIPIAGVMPYAQSTPAAGVSGELVYLPAGAAIAGRDLSGKILVREIGVTSLPNAVLAALAWFTYDLDFSLALDLPNNYDREAIHETAPDNEAAHAAGALGVIFVHGFSREQAQGVYAPYEGLVWPLPAVYVGADEGKILQELAANGGRAQIQLSAQVAPAETRMLIATLPGESPERIVITSHTDGSNALWDNGPLAMLEMARYYAQFVQGCRPRALEFAFTTSHLHQRLLPPQRDGSAEQYAQELDAGWEAGTVAAVVVIEHLGARRYDAVPRTDGGSGRKLVLSDIHEPNSFFVSESPALIATLLATVVQHNLIRTIALRGADLPGAHLPLHWSFGGEGGPYNKHLIPTVAFIVAPWTLFTEGAGLEGIDMDYAHRQTLLFTDLVHNLGLIPRVALAGAFIGERAVRDALCAAGLKGGLVLCEFTPSAPSTQPPLRALGLDGLPL